MNKNEFIQQYGHTWRVFEKLVNDFDAEAWLHTGRGVITPARLALHILLGTQYYLEDKTPFQFPSGKPFEIDWHTIKTDDLPSQNDILAFIHEMMDKTEKWLFDLEYGAENKSFPWAGETQLGVVIFLLRHNLFHIGELSSLLNESKAGVVEDHYVKALRIGYFQDCASINITHYFCLKKVVFMKVSSAALASNIAVNRNIIHAKTASGS